MEFKILGPLVVVVGGQELDIGPRRQRAVLALLLLSAGRVVSLDRMVAELWGDQPPAQAIGTLQAYVSNLRRVLEPGRRPRDPAQVLVTRPPGYALAIDLEAVDSHRFEAAARDGGRLLAEGRPGPARRLLADALALWRGAALADFASEPFAAADAARLDELRLVATEDCLQADLDVGALGSAVTGLQALVAAHPLRERLWALLMVGLYRSGRRTDALAAYRSAQATLDDELGIEPGPALRRLQRDILDRVPSLDWRPPPAERLATSDGDTTRLPAPVPAEVHPSRSSGLGSPLVGRQPELARLRVAMARAAAARGGVVLVEGEGGIGKTRLVEEALAGDGGQGREPVVAWGRAVEGGATPAYWPWVEVVRTLVARYDPDLLREAIGAGAAELAQIVPEVKELIPAVEPPAALDPSTARQHLFRAMTRCLTGVARDRPLVVVLDDLQWADVASLQLLGGLAPNLAHHPLLVIGNYRAAEVGPGHPLAETLAVLSRHQVVERIDLAGLSADEVGGLVAAVTGAVPDDEVVVKVHARTDGNPFFVAELARLLASEAHLPAAHVAGAVPTGVGDVVRRRVGRLPEQTAAILAVAAVAGRDFESRVLEAAAGLDPERTLDLIESALVSGLVIEHPDDVGRFRFGHDLVREALLSELTGARRARLHAKVGDAIGALYGDEPGHAVELAHHLFHAATAGAVDPIRAIATATRAAEVAAARVAYEQAEEQLRRALALVDRLPAGVERDGRELDVLLRLHPLLMSTRGWAAPETGLVLERAHPLSERLGRTRELVPVLYGLFAFHLGGSDYRAAASLADRLLALASQSGDPAHLVVAHEAWGLNAVHMGDFAAARDHFFEAESLPEGLADGWLVNWFPIHPLVGLLTFGGWNQWLLGDQDRGWEMMHEALAFSRGHGQPTDTAHALHCLGFLAVSQRDAPELRETVEAAVRSSRDQGMALYSAFNTALLGWAVAREGDVAEGIALIGDGLAAIGATGTHMHVTFFKALLAEAQAWAGRPEEALASVDEALALAARTGERFWESELHRLRGEFMLTLGGDRRAAAEEALEAAVAVALAQQSTPLAARAASSLARVRQPA